MNRKPAAHLPKIPGIDLDYRPRDYFWALDGNVRLPSGISGEARRKLFRARIEAGSTVHDGLDVELLDKPLRVVPDLCPHHVALTEAWSDQWAREESDEN